MTESRTSRIGMAALATMLVLSGCDSRSALQKSADAAAARRGKTFTPAAEVDGVHERAICGKVGGQTAIYREDADRLMIQTDFPAETWAALYRSWCGGR